MTFFRKTLLVLILAPLCHACRQENAETRLNVSAKRLDGSPVALAKVTIDGSDVGETNAFGTFTDLMYLSPETEHLVNVSYDDPTYYYSPHTMRFNVQPGSPNDIQVQATMYLAPKPKKNGFASAVTVTTPEVKGLSTARSSDLPSDDRFNLPLLLVTTADFTERSISKSITSNPPTIMFTAHAFSGHTALAGATVIWSEANLHEHQCTTNDRGRCVIQALANSRTPGTLLVRKSGFESTSKSLMAVENQNVRLKLAPGTSLDIRLMSVSLKTELPYDSVKIYDGNTHLGTSDNNGYATIPIPAKRHVDLKFTPPGEATAIDAGEFSEFSEVIKIKLAGQKNETFDYKISDVHVFKNNDIKLGHQILDAVIGTLIKETAGKRTRSIDFSSKAADANFIGIIPILEGSPKGLTLTLTAFEPSTGLVMSEQINHIPHSESALEAAVSTLLDSIKKRQSSYGFIERVDGNQLQVSIDTETVQTGDVLDIVRDDLNLKAIVLSTRKGKATAKLSTISPAKNAWRLLGEKTVRPARDASKISSMSDLLAKLMPKTPESEKIELARKHRLENNPRQSLRDLDLNKFEDHPTRILILQERADAHLALDEKGLALASLYDALSLALEHAPLSVVNIISININRIRAETLPALNNDKDLIENLKELDSDNVRLMKALSVQKLDPIAEATLQYATLLTKQKLAEASLDVTSMTTLEQSWDTFLKGLAHTNNNERAAEINKAATFSRKPFLIKHDESSVRL